jgi:plastocyanin
MLRSRRIVLRTLLGLQAAIIAGALVSACSAQPTPPATSAVPAPTTSEVTGVVPVNAIVTLLPAGDPPPVPTEPATMDQISKQFIPNVLLARVGQPVVFHNGEDLPHNITVTRRSSGAEVFNVSTERSQTYTHTFDRVGQFDVRCDIHEGMEAIIIVALGPVTTIAGDDGRFSIPNVAFGSYKLSVTFAGQTVERAFDAAGPRTEVNLAP